MPTNNITHFLFASLPTLLIIFLSFARRLPFCPVQTEGAKSDNQKNHNTKGASYLSGTWYIDPKVTIRNVMPINSEIKFTAVYTKRKWQEAGEDCIMWSFITCTLHRILLG